MNRSAADTEFTEFVRRATPSLRRTAWLLTGDREAAADLLQQALMKTYLAWHRVRADEASAYTRKVLANVAIDTWRKGRDIPVGGDFDRPVRDRSTSVDDHDEIVRLLAALPAQQRAVIVLRYFEDLTETATANELGISVGAVKSACSRGLATLRALEARPEGSLT